MTNRNQFLLLFLILVLIQVAWFMVWGVRSGGDTGRYIGGAQRLLSDGVNAEFGLKAILSFGYIAFIAAHKLFTDNMLYPVLSQMALHIGCAVLLWTIIRKYCSPWVAGALVILFSVFPYLSRWNFYILTDSLAISSSVIVCYLVHKVCTEENYKIWPYTPLLLFIALIRPHTATVVLGFAAFLFFFKAFSERRIALRHGIVLLIPCAVVLVMVLMNFDAISRDLLKALTVGHIIGGAWSIDMSGLSGDESILVKTWLVVKLFSLRVFSEALMVRTYYSLPNNLHLVAYGVLIYGLALIGVLSRGHHWLKIGLLTGILANFGLIGITYASWDGRYGMYTMAQIWVLMALGAGWLETRLAGSGWLKHVVAKGRE